jgi:hypothetical protein
MPNRKKWNTHIDIDVTSNGNGTYTATLSRADSDAATHETISAATIGAYAAEMIDNIEQEQTHKSHLESGYILIWTDGYEMRAERFSCRKTACAALKKQYKETRTNECGGHIPDEWKDMCHCDEFEADLYTGENVYLWRLFKTDYPTAVCDNEAFVSQINQSKDDASIVRLFKCANVADASTKMYQAAAKLIEDVNKELVETFFQADILDENLVTEDSTIEDFAYEFIDWLSPRFVTKHSDSSISVYLGLIGGEKNSRMDFTIVPSKSNADTEPYWE